MSEQNLDVTTDEPIRVPLIQGGYKFKDITNKVCEIFEKEKAPKQWKAFFYFFH